MALSLEGKKVLITGSTDGLGKVLALELAKLGAKLILHGKNEQKLQAVRSELDNINKNSVLDALICDFRTPKTISSIFSQISSLDILINNTGVWLEGDTVNATPDKILELVNVNLASYTLVTRTLLPHLLKSEFGQILNVVSVAGIEVPFDYYHTIYSATKFGLQGFSEALAKEFFDKNLRVMGFYPGGMTTKLFQKAGMDYEKVEPWMFDTIESAEVIIFMLTRNPKVNIKRLDLINQLNKNL